MVIKIVAGDVKKKRNKIYTPAKAHPGKKPDGLVFKIFCSEVKGEREYDWGKPQHTLLLFLCHRKLHSSGDCQSPLAEAA